MTLTITRPEKIVPLCLNLGLKSAHEAAEAALAQAKRDTANDPREGGHPAVTEAAAEVQRIEAEMSEHTVEFVLRALPRKVWVEFEESHKPREGREDDKNYTLDISALDLVLSGLVEPDGTRHESIAAVRSLGGKPVLFVPATDWAPLADEITSGQWNEFALAILALNRGVTKAPFSSAASAAIRRSELTSKPLNA